MNFRVYEHRFALSILETNSDFTYLWDEIQEVISSVTDEMIIENFQNKYTNQKSISRSINELLKDKFIEYHWQSESLIFQNPNYTGDTWRLDFAKDNISIEVAFNHRGVISWNLMKLVLASELNHVNKAIQTELGIIICATYDLIRAGGFDSAVGSFEKFIDYLIPMRNQLSVPILLIGLEAPNTFRIEHEKITGKILVR